MADARRGARQSAYELLVASTPALLRAGKADVWDSGLVTADSSVDVTYGGPPLEPRRRYWWTVCIRDRGGRAAPCAAPSWWETGMMGGPWVATWIAASSAPLDTIAPATTDTAVSAAGRVPLLRRAVRLSAVPVRARVYATALGSYRLTVNGAPAGPGVLVPDWTDYRYRLTYQTYDVTRLLRRGGNAVGVVLGAGWYAGRMGYSSKRYAYGPPPVRLLLELHLTYADGHEDVIASDTSWRAAAGPILFSEIYDGEAYDARLEQPGWDRPGFDDGRWARRDPGAGAFARSAVAEHPADRENGRAASQDALVARTGHLGLRPRPEHRRVGAPAWCAESAARACACASPRSSIRTGRTSRRSTSAAPRRRTRTC